MSDNEPLLGQNANTRDEDSWDWRPGYHRAQEATASLMNSRAKHWLVLVLIILDVAGILSDIFIALITCELDVEHDEWVAPTRRGLAILSLTLSSVFLVELIMSVFADGLRYFSSWLHTFDGIVIVVGFAVDLLEHNTAGEIASLIVILRLWRFVKIVDEFSVEAEERAEGQTEELRKRIADLETQNAALEAQIGR
ncbi:hypothetical protein GGR52DRAFT_570093 [Hypoxylon sp. FL1284]|nr:hypothetical protein GGR52DRAFT_570093 [Hypoxylon sp. FL1284]